MYVCCLQVNLVIPVLFVLVCLFLVVQPVYETPRIFWLGVGVTAAGLPVYYLGVVCTSKPAWFNSIMSKTLPHGFIIIGKKKRRMYSRTPSPNVRFIQGLKKNLTLGYCL